MLAASQHDRTREVRRVAHPDPAAAAAQTSDLIRQAARKTILAPIFGTTGLMPRFPHLELTARERQVAGLYLAGMSRKQIAGELGIASGTVKAHLTSIASRLGIRLRERGAIRAALKGYLDNPDTVGAIGEMAE